MADIPGIPGYKIVSKLNEGGMAVVYLGIQEKLNRKVAIKILESFLLITKDTAVRFEQEAKTAASLSHSNIIQIHDTGKIDEYHYIVMEYLEVVLKHIDSPVPRLPRNLNRYQPLIDKMMDKDREKRISSGPEFNLLLDRILTNSLGPIPQPGTSSDSSTTVTTIPAQKIESTPSLTQTTQEYPALKKSTNKIKSLFKKYLDFIKINFAPGKGLKKQNVGTQTVVLNTAESKQQQVQEKLNLANQYFEKALTILKELENIKDTREVKELEKKINQSLTNIKNQVPPVSPID